MVATNLFWEEQDIVPAQAWSSAWSNIGSAILVPGALWPGTGFGGITLTILMLGGQSAAATIRTQALVVAIATSLATMASVAHTPTPPTRG